MLAPTIACTHLAERGVREGEVEGEAEGLKLEEVWLENGDSPGTLSSSLKEGRGGSDVDEARQEHNIISH